MMPSVLPRTSKLPLADLSHPPSCAATERGTTRRSSMTISPITSSATLRVLENGALKTGTPILLRGVEIDLVGADAETADRHQPVGGFENLRRDMRARTDAEHMHAFVFLSPIYPAINSLVLAALPKARHGAMSGLIVVFSALGGTLGSIITGFLFKKVGGINAFYFSLIPISILAIALFMFNKIKGKSSANIQLANELLV